MLIELIIAHPNRESFNHAIADRVSRELESQSHQVQWNDLYANHFDPVMPFGEELKDDSEIAYEIQREITGLKKADGLIFIHPNWWSGPPAILRGWIDRVFRRGVAYRFTPEGPVPLLNEKAIQVYTTANTPHEVEEKVYQNYTENFWRKIVFGLCGNKSFAYKSFAPVVMSTPEDRAGWLDDAATMARSMFSDSCPHSPAIDVVLGCDRRNR